jgi:DNA-binding IclR family transcriptional regulator
MEYKSLRRALSVIKAFSVDNLEMTCAEVARKLGVSSITAYRILTAFKKEGLLEQNPDNKKYHIGAELYIKGSLFLRATNLSDAARPILKEMNNLTEEVVNLSIYDPEEGYVTHILREESKHRLRLAGYVGFTAPAYVLAVGKSFLSELDEAELDRLYPDEDLQKITPKTVATKTELKRELEQIRKTGVAINSEQAWEGEEAYSAIIREPGGNAVATLGIAVPKIRIDSKKREKLVSFVKLGAGLISYRIGYHDPSNTIHDIDELRNWWREN